MNWEDEYRKLQTLLKRLEKNQPKLASTTLEMLDRIERYGRIAKRVRILIEKKRKDNP